MKKIISLIVFCLILFSSACFASSLGKSWIFVQDVHLVRQGETLDSIAQDFMKKNTYGQREIREFTEGIRELNSWLEKRDIHYADILYINYWIKKDVVRF